MNHNEFLCSFEYKIEALAIYIVRYFQYLHWQHSWSHTYVCVYIETHILHHHTFISTLLVFKLTLICSLRCSTTGVNIFIQCSFSGENLLGGTGTIRYSGRPPWKRDRAKGKDHRLHNIIMGSR